MELHDIPLEQLSRAKINARTHGATEPLDTLAASIRAQGVLQPLLVRPMAGGDRFEIIAGQRRFLAGQRLAQDAPVDPLPCLVRAATDDVAALEISLAENLERLSMEPFDQHEAFAHLVKRGQHVETIAARFGVTERLVNQRLALAGLIEPIKREVRQGAVDRADAQVLALATPRQPRAWLKLYRDQAQSIPHGRSLKAWLCGGGAIATEVALFPLERDPGRRVTDLFGDQTFFDDSAPFWTRQHQAIAARQDQLRTEGWARVEVLEIGDSFRSWEYQRTAKEQGGWVLIRPQPTGAVRADRTPPHGPAVAASVATGTARAAFAEARRAVTGEPDATDATLLGHGHGERQTVEAFARLLELSDEPVLKALAVATAETLVAGSGLAERLGELLQIDLRRFWKPDETFLDLLTDKAALGRIAAEGARPRPARRPGRNYVG